MQPIRASVSSYELICFMFILLPTHVFSSIHLHGPSGDKPVVKVAFLQEGESMVDNVGNLTENVIVIAKFVSDDINPYYCLKRACQATREGASVIIASVSCESAIALRSWSFTHMIPLIVLPTGPCFDQPLMNDQTGPVMLLETEVYAFHKPAIEMASQNTKGRIMVILDNEYYKALYLDENVLAEQAMKANVFVLNVNEINEKMFKDLYKSGTSENFVVIGNQKACQDVIHAGKGAAVFKIKFSWIMACYHTNSSQLHVTRDMMANMYLISDEHHAEMSQERRQTEMENLVRELLQTIYKSHIELEFPDFKADEMECFKLPNKAWDQGIVLMNKIRDELSRNNHGTHSHRNVFNIFKLDIESRKWALYSRWDSVTGCTPLKPVNQDSLKDIDQRHLKIATVVEPPFVSMVLTPHGPRFEGYCIELLEHIKHRLNFTYEVYNVSSYGAYSDNTWNGAVGEVVYKRADMAVSGMIITSARQDVVDFSSRYMDYSVGIIIRKNIKNEDGFGFLAPLNTSVWLSFAGLIFGIGLLMYALTRMSPSAQKINELSGFTDLSKFDLHNSIWFTISSIMMQGVDIQPATPSGRLIGTFWWFFSLTVTAMYTANLAAFLTVNRMETPIDSLQSLAYQQKIKYGTVRDSPVHLDFVEQSEIIPLYERIATTLESEPKSLVEYAEDGYANVKRGDYAFMWDDPILQWMKSRHCEFVTVGKAFMNKGYGIAIQKGSVLTEMISTQILQLQDEGILEKLKESWFETTAKCITGSHSSSSGNQDEGSKGIKLETVQGIFIVLTLGVLLATIVTFVEIWWARHFKQSDWKAPDQVIENEGIISSERLLAGDSPKRRCDIKLEPYTNSKSLEAGQNHNHVSTPIYDNCQLKTTRRAAMALLQRQASLDKCNHFNDQTIQTVLS